MNRYRLFLLVLAVLVLVGCRQQTPTPTPETTLQIEMQPDPTPPAVGAGALVITILDASGQPVNDASVSARGDMNHAGMAPILADVDGGDNGVYRVPFEWTMGGDWFVDVTVTLPDGTAITRRFDLTVQS